MGQMEAKNSVSILGVLGLYSRRLRPWGVQGGEGRICISAVDSFLVISNIFRSSHHAGLYEPDIITYLVRSLLLVDFISPGIINLSFSSYITSTIQ